MSGAVTPASSMRCLISGTACAASGRLTVTRTISEPASASSMHWRAVPAASAVSVMVIDWTTTGAPPPTCTPPTLTPMLRCNFRTAIFRNVVSDSDSAAWPLLALFGSGGFGDERLQLAGGGLIDIHEFQAG